MSENTFTPAEAPENLAADTADAAEVHEKPEELTKLAQHECILVHAQAGYRKVTLPPLEADGTVSKWYHGLWLGS